MKPQIKIVEQYHPDIMVTAIKFKNDVVGAIYDNEIFKEGIADMWN